MLPSFFIDYFKSKFEIINAQVISGGSINECYLLKTSAGYFFLKVNSTGKFPNLFEAEVKGLKLIAATKTVKVPEICEAGEINGRTFLLLKYIEKSIITGSAMFKFGEEVAKMHQHSSAYFGLNDDNYIGSLTQDNTPMKSWAEFFVEMRLWPMVRMAHDRYRLSLSLINDFEQLFGKIKSLFPEEKPALLHGDLWGGNYLIDGSGHAYLIDPAVYYGHREMDIAMTKLFGGFGPGFYWGYKDVYPLEKGWEQRVDLCNLYPILVHLNLFGGAYLSQLKQALRNYV